MNIGIVTSFYNGYGRYMWQWTKSVCALKRDPAQVTMVAMGKGHGLTKDLQKRCEDLLKKRGLKYKIVETEKNLGMGHGRNMAVKETPTEWICYLDADDTIMPRAINEWEKYENDADVIASGFRVIGAKRHRIVLLPQSSAKFILAGGNGANSHSPYRRALWERSPYLEWTDLNEKALWIGFAHLDARFVPTKRPCTVYRSRKGGHNLSLTPERRAEARALRDKFRRDGLIFEDPEKTRNEDGPDLLYILGKGSMWDDNELRYSLRSVEKYWEGGGRVFVVGHKPKWIRNVRHIPAEDRYDSPVKNTIAKLREACRSDELRERFILMNDDFIFLKPINGTKPATCGLLSDKVKEHSTKDGAYYRANAETLQLIKMTGIAEPKNFEIHVPMEFEKAKLMEITNRITWTETPYSIRSIYGNIYIKKSIELEDVKVYRPADIKDAEKRFMISTSTRLVLHPKFRNWIAKKFPKASRYECIG